MGILNKFLNWIRFRGWKEPVEDIEIDKPSPMEEAESLGTSTIPDEIKQEPQETRIKEETKKEYKQPRQLKEKSKDEFDKAMEKIKSTKSVKELESKINPEKVNSIQLGLYDARFTALRGVYEDLFTQNDKINDPEILKLVMRHRNELRHRFTATVRVWSEGAEMLTFTVAGILPEDCEIIKRYFAPGEPFPMPYPENVANAIISIYMSEPYNAKGGSIEFANKTQNDSATIDDSRIEFSFS